MHSLLIVIGNVNPDVVMAPFDENLEVPKYNNGPVSDWDKEHCVKFYEEKLGKKYASFDECYAENGYDWNFNRWEKGDDGVWYEFSTYNPDSKWDWWQLGGRWPGRLQLKEGAQPVKAPSFSLLIDKKERQEFLEKNPNCADVAYKKDIANLDTLLAAAVLKDGVWEDIDENGCFKPVAKYLEDVPDDTLISCIDYHI